MDIFKPLVKRISKTALTKSIAKVQAAAELDEYPSRCTFSEGTSWTGKPWIRAFANGVGYSSKYYYDAGSDTE